MNMLSLIGRYSFSKYNRHRSSSLKIAFSFALSLAVLMITLSVMQMLQTSRFDNLRAIRSFDITVKDASVGEIRALYPDCSVFAYKESYALIDGNAFLIRYVDESYDGNINILAGDLSSMMVSYSSSLSFKSDEVGFSTLLKSGGRSVPINRNIRISGIYYTVIPGEFDSYYAFMPYDAAPEDLAPLIAIKGSDDVSILDENGYEYETWKEKESTLYSAFALESVMMFCVLAVLLVIVYVEIRGESRVFLNNKRKERLELLIIGYNRAATDIIFIVSFLFILFIGSLLAIVLQEVGIMAFRLFLREALGSYDRNLSIDYALFLKINVVFFILTALTVLHFLGKSNRKSIMEALHG